MAILAECPVCHKKQATKNKACSCGQDLVKAKRSKRVRYWIQYRLPGPEGKQRKEYVGKSIEEARDADGKRKVQKRENRIFDMLPESKLTFNELKAWYLALGSVQKLASYSRVVGCLDNMAEVFGDRLLADLKPLDLEEYQNAREDQGRSPATIDMELSIARTMITKAFDNDMVDGRIVKTFKRVKKKLKKNANVRKRTLTLEEYESLTTDANKYPAPLIIAAYHTGMRRGELLALRWKHIDRKAGFIRLPEELTKEGKPKSIPINHFVETALTTLTRALHHDYVFTFRGKPIQKTRRSIETAFKNAGIPYGRKAEGGATFHDIRGTFKTNMLRAGVDKVLRDTILGHSYEGMDSHYLSLEDEDLTRAMDRFTDWFDAQIADVTQTVTQNGTEG